MIRRIVLAMVLLVGATETSRAQTQATGGIRGSVTDKDFRVPLAGVRVSVVGTTLGASTRADGSFVVEGVPAGSYTLSFSRDGYERELLSSVVVLPGRLTDVSAGLGSEVIDMDELVVTAQDLLADAGLGLLEIRAASVTMQDAISSEIISKSGASDVAGALKFVVGASVVGGKYATVRGLSDRYTGTTLNGVRVPSADPRRRAVQVDLFPTGTVESVTVTKTFTPDLQGDFTGGGVDIKTSSIPDGRVLAVSFGVEHNDQATHNDRFLSYSGGGVDTWGFAGSDRQLPAAAREPLPALPNPSYGATAEQLDRAVAWDRLVRSFSPVMGVSEKAPEENQSWSLVAGNRFELGGERVLGLLGALTHANKRDFYENGENNVATVNDPSAPLTPGAVRRDSKGTDEVLVGALASIFYRSSERHGLGLRLIANQAAEDEARFQASGSGRVEQNQSLHYTERTVGSAQLHGDHELPEAAFRGLSLDWVASFNITRQEEPDVRFFRDIFDTQFLTGRQPPNSTEPQNTRRIFREVGEDNRQAAFNVRLPFERGDVEGQLKLGLFLDRTDRDYEQRSFSYQFGLPQLGMQAQANLGLSRFQAESADQLWTDVFLSPDHIGLAPFRCPVGSPAAACAPPTQLLWYIRPLNDDVDYTGDQRISAAYAMAEVPLGAKLRLIGGARYETTELAIVPVSPISGLVEIIEIQASGDRAVVDVPQEQGQVSIDDPRLLPALGAVYAVKPEMSVRLSASRTLARPTFRELAPVATEEFIFGDEFVGNQNLVLSSIENYDLRWEWFRRPGEVLAASVFYKQIDDPIELISFASSGRSFIQPVNYERGSVHGFEIEARAPLEALAPGMKGFTAGINYTHIDSEVDVPPAEQESLASFGLDEPSRRLQGQPAYLFNANLTWDHERWGSSAGLFYNVVGETLLTGAARGAEDGVPNVFEESYPSLDLSLSQKLPQWRKEVSLTLRAKNLLHPERRAVFRTPGGEEAIKTERETAVTYGLGIGLKW